MTSHRITKQRSSGRGSVGMLANVGIVIYCWVCGHIYVDIMSSKMLLEKK